MSQEALTIKKTLIAALVLLVIGYAVFISRFVIEGPEITINNFDEDSSVIISPDKTLFLEGNVSHSSFISIDGRPIFIDESGNFNEKLLLSSSMSIINIYAKDKFGKEVRKKIDVLYNGDTENTDYAKVALDSNLIASTTIQNSSSSLSSSLSLSTSPSELSMQATSSDSETQSE